MCCCCCHGQETVAETPAGKKQMPVLQTASSMQQPETPSAPEKQVKESNNLSLLQLLGTLLTPRLWSFSLNQSQLWCNDLVMEHGSYFSSLFLKIHVCAMQSQQESSIDLEALLNWMRSQSKAVSFDGVAAGLGLVGGKAALLRQTMDTLLSEFEIYETGVCTGQYQVL